MTPDKREVLIVQEQLVIEKLKAVVDALYAPVRNTMQLNQGITGSGGGGFFAVKRTSNDSAVDRVFITPDDSPEMDEKDNSRDIADEHFKHDDLRPLSKSREMSETSYSRVVRTLTSPVQDTGSVENDYDQSMLKRQRVSPLIVEQKTARDNDSSTVIWKLKCDQILAGFKQKRCAAREYRSSLKKRTHTDINRGADGMLIHSSSAYKCDDEDESFDVSLEAQAHPQADRSQPRVLSKKVCDSSSLSSHLLLIIADFYSTYLHYQF